MKIFVAQITDTPKELSFTEGTDELNRLYAGDARDFHFPQQLDVQVTYYRSGADLFFHGRVGASVEGSCGRCLKEYSFPLNKEFDFILAPDTRSTKNKELNQEEMGLSFYSGEEIDLTPFVREQVLLTLPTRPLCGEDCRGLCPGCGADLNEDSCRCASSQGDSRMMLFRDMKLQQ
jgi:uncharacterized protein